MQKGQPRPARSAGDAKGGGGSTIESGTNWERMVFCLSSLVGQKVTAKLRNNNVYEGIFHSCAVQGDQTITLKSARRVEDDKPSGEVIPTLMINGKDFLQVNALDLPPAPGSRAQGRRGFATDAEIAGARRGPEARARELVPWGDASAAEGASLEEEGHRPGTWDQFAANEKQFGVTSSFTEEAYTTKIDEAALSSEQRAKAEATAQAIEKGRGYAEVEGQVDSKADDGDEEARFAGARPAGRGAPLPEVPQRAQEEESDAVRKSRGMMSEMKRINALNLEPTTAKSDDAGGRSKGMNFRESNARAGRAGLDGKEPVSRQNLASIKEEFQKNLKEMDAKRGRREAEATSGTPAGAKSGSLNPGAKAFSLNPKAGEFTPSGAERGAAAAAAQNLGAAPSPAGPSLLNSPPFELKVKNPVTLKKMLNELLVPFFQLACNRAPDSESSGWPDATRSTIMVNDVLGTPSGSPPQLPGGGQMAMGTMMPMAMRGGPGGCQAATFGGQGCQGGGPCHGATGPMQAAGGCPTGPQGGWQQGCGGGPEQAAGTGPSGGCGGCGCGGGCCGGGCTGCTGCGGCCGGCTGCGGCGQQMVFLQPNMANMANMQFYIPTTAGGGAPQGAMQGWQQQMRPQGNQQMMMVPMMCGPNGQYMQPGFMPTQQMQGQPGPGMNQGGQADGQQMGGFKRGS